jgi:hypothetical protein
MSRTSLIHAESTSAIYRIRAGIPLEGHEQLTAFGRISDHALAIQLAYGMYREPAPSQGSSQGSTSYAAPSTSTGTAPCHYLSYRTSMNLLYNTMV